LAILGSVSNSKDSVIEGGSAICRGEDTTSIHLEDGLVGLNSNRDWSLGDGSLKVSWAFGLNVGISGGLDFALGFVISALAVLGNIWVVGLRFEWVSLCVQEGKTHRSTIASVIQPRAVNELGLGEGDEVSSGDEVSTLHGTGGRERPA
jgi:hypothetical protein